MPASWVLGPEVSRQASGQLELQLRWPSERQLLALSDLHRLEVKLLREGQVLTSRTVEASALQAQQGRVSFTELTVGPIQVQVRALDHEGLLLGFAQGEGSILAGQSSRVPLLLQVGGPSTSGNLGVDLTVAEGEASGGAKGYQLSKVLPLPFVWQGYTPPGGQLPVIPSVGQVLVHPTTGQVWVAMRHQGLVRFTADASASQAIFLGVMANQVAPLPDGGVLVANGDEGLWQVSADGLASSTLNPGNTSTTFTPYGWRHQLATDHLGRPLLWDASTGQLSGAALTQATHSQSGYWALPEARFQVQWASDPASRPVLLHHDPIRRDFTCNSFLNQAQLKRFDLRGNAQVLAPLERGLPSVPAGGDAAEAASFRDDLDAAHGLWPGEVKGLGSDGRGGTLFASVRYATVSHPLFSLWRHAPGRPLVRVWGPRLSPSEIARSEAAFADPNSDGYLLNMGQAQGLLRQSSGVYPLWSSQLVFHAAAGKAVVADAISLRVFTETP